MSRERRRAKVVRPTSGAGTADGGADRRFSGVTEAASAPIGEFGSATEFYHSLGGAANAAVAMSDMFKRFGESAKDSIRLNNDMQEALDQYSSITQSVAEAIGESQSTFSRSHEEDWERLSNPTRERAWDVGRNV